MLLKLFGGMDIDVTYEEGSVHSDEEGCHTSHENPNSY